MPIIPRRNSDSQPVEGQDLYTWARQLPPCTVHVRESSGYVGCFSSHEIQGDMPIEEYLLSEFGVGTFELVAHANGLFLPGRQKVHIGSQADRQAARHAQATRDAQGSGGALGDIPQVVAMLKDLGWTPGQQTNQGNNELTTMLVQHAVKTLQPPDPAETMDQVVGLMKSMNELQRNNAPPLPPRRKRRHKKQDASDETRPTSGIGDFNGMATAAVLGGAGFAMRHPDITKKVSDGISAKAQGAVNWFRQRTQTPTEESVSAATKDGTPATGSDPAVTLEQAIESAKTMLATPIGQRMVDYVRGSIHDVAPEDIARRGLDGARQWLGADHPLLMRLHEDPGRVFDEMSEIVGLTGDSWWKARSHFVAMMTDEEDETPTSAPSAGEAPRASAQGTQTVTQEPVERHGAEDVRNASGLDNAAGPATDADEREESIGGVEPGDGDR